MIRHFSVFLVLIFISQEAFSNSVSIGFIERPPSIYANADGEMRGILGKELADIIFNANLDVDFVPVLPEDINAFMTMTNLDGFIASKTLIQNESDFRFSQMPLVYITFYAYHLESTKPLGNLADLNNASVVVPLSMEEVKGRLKDTLIDQSKNITVTGVESDFEKQMMQLRQGKVDYAISYFSPNNVAMLFSSRSKSNKIESSELFKLPLYLVFRADSKQADITIRKINNAMATH